MRARTRFHFSDLQYFFVQFLKGNCQLWDGMWLFFGYCLYSYLLVLDRTNWRTKILTALLIPYIFLSLPSLLFHLFRWYIIFFKVAFHIFFNAILRFIFSLEIYVSVANPFIIHGSNLFDYAEETLENGLLSLQLYCASSFLNVFQVPQSFLFITFHFQSSEKHTILHKKLIHKHVVLLRSIECHMFVNQLLCTILWV